MVNCLLDEKEFASEKSVVLEELAMGEDDPWQSLYQHVESLLFQVHPYHHPVIGWKEDLQQLSVETMRSYYQPALWTGPRVHGRRGQLRPGADRGACGRAFWSATGRH